MDLNDKLRKIEAFLTSIKNALEHSKQSDLKSIKEETENLIEYTISLGDYWKKKLFVALCGLYQLRTYRYRRQKYSIVMVQTSKDCMDNILLPEFKKYVTLFEGLIQEIRDDLISQISSHEDKEVIIDGEIPPIIEPLSL